MIEKYRKHLLIGIVLLAFFFRIYGINWDQGYHLHPDERAIVLSVINLQLPASLHDFLNPQSSWNPHFFAYGSFPFYLLRLCGNILGFLALPSLSEYSNINLVGRFLSSIFDIGTLLLLYKLGRRFFSTSLGLTAGLFYALSVLPIQLSHFYAVDTILTFFTTGAIYYCIVLEKKRTRQAAILCGLFLGFALATKISAIMLFIPIGIALLYTLINNKESHATIGWSLIFGCIIAATASIIFAITSPYALIDFQNFLKDTQMQSAMIKDAFVFPYTLQYVLKTPYIHELKNVFLFGLGPIIASLSFVGLLVFLIQTIKERDYESQARNLIILSFFIVYFLIVGSFKIGFMRYLLPLYPLCCLFAAVATMTFYSYLEKKIARAIALGTLSVLGLSLFIWPVSFINIYSTNNTRVQATQWILQNIPAGKTIAIEHWDDSLPLAHINNYKTQTLPLYDPDTDEKWQQIDSSLRESDYLIIASNRLYVPLMQLTDCNTLPKDRCYPRASNYYQKLFSGNRGFEKVAEFSTQPTIPIVGIPINDESADESFTVYDHPKVMIFKKK